MQKKKYKNNIEKKFHLINCLKLTMKKKNKIQKHRKNFHLGELLETT